MESKAKYSLFPTNGAAQEHRPQSAPRPTTTPTGPLPPNSSKPPNSPPSLHTSIRSTDPPKSSPPLSPSPARDMYAPCTTVSTTSSETSFHKPPVPHAPQAFDPTPSRSRPKTVYYHNSIGGRGNYHKAIKDKENTPQSALRPLPRPSRSPNFLSSLFGRKSRDQSPAERECDGRAELGAAEAMKRKLIGKSIGDGKRSLSREIG